MISRVEKKDTRGILSENKFENLRVQQKYIAYACLNLTDVQNLCRISLESDRIKIAMKKLFVSKFWLRAAAYDRRSKAIWAIP